MSRSPRTPNRPSSKALSLVDVGLGREVPSLVCSGIGQKDMSFGIPVEKQGLVGRREGFLEEELLEMGLELCTEVFKAEVRVMQWALIASGPQVPSNEGCC